MAPPQDGARIRRRFPRGATRNIVGSYRPADGIARVSNNIANGTSTARGFTRLEHSIVYRRPGVARKFKTKNSKLRTRSGYTCGLEVVVVFGTLGMPELILIFVVALLLFGPRKMPQIGKSVGRALGEFRRASNEFKRTIEDEVAADDLRDVGKDLKGLSDIGNDLKDLKRTIEKPIETTLKKALEAPTEGDATTATTEESETP
jgi:TatA/E family protein of Tat protein translocase